MKYPEKVYLRPRNAVDGMALGEFKANELSFYNENEPKIANYVEYIRSDIAKQTAKDFAEWLWKNAKPNGEGLYETWGEEVGTIDELFTEFNSRKK